jgi:hypothetical protein
MASLTRARIRIPARENDAEPVEFFPDELPIGGDRGISTTTTTITTITTTTFITINN